MKEVPQGIDKLIIEEAEMYELSQEVLYGAAENIYLDDHMELQITQILSLPDVRGTKQAESLKKVINDYLTYAAKYNETRGTNTAETLREILELQDNIEGIAKEMKEDVEEGNSYLYDRIHQLGEFGDYYED